VRTCTSGSPRARGPPVDSPPEINDSVRLNGGGGGAAVINWSDPPGTYNVYRGFNGGPWLYNHTCFELNVPAPPAHDATIPASGGLYCYLVSRRDNVCGLESILGRNSAGVPDPNPTPCP
jgi:hypothetical protein